MNCLQACTATKWSNLNSSVPPSKWIPVNEDVARAAGTLALRYRRAYQGIDDVDYLIAGTALALGAEILTTNVRHVPMFPGLQPPY